MDTYPQVADLQNTRKQSALHVCLESNALECYQTLIRCRCPSLDIRAEDLFGQLPVTCWKRVMEQKREASSLGWRAPPQTAPVSPTRSSERWFSPPSRSPTTRPAPSLLPTPFPHYFSTHRQAKLPPEQAERARVLLSEAKGGSLRVRSLQDRVEFRTEAGMAPMPAILRVHDVNYVMRLVGACQKSKVFPVWRAHLARKPPGLAGRRHDGLRAELSAGAARGADGLLGGGRALPGLCGELESPERVLRGPAAGTPHRDRRAGEKPEQPGGDAGLLPAEQCGDRRGVRAVEIPAVCADRDRGSGHSSRKRDGGLRAALESVPKRSLVGDGECGDQVGKTAQ